MKFSSVHGQSPACRFSEALFTGLAPDGGLYAPESIPALSGGFLGDLDSKSLHEIGLAMLAPFIDEIPEADLAAILHQAWDFPIPVTPLFENVHLLELFHGPTLAFKDVGARFMARTLSWFLEREARDVTLLVATSGDTGSAVAHGFAGVPRISVFVLYPSGRISPLQERQITTVGGNVQAVEVAGTFDDCQKLVKEALSDQVVRTARTLTTANSINLGRLLPQAAYYGWAMAQWISTATGAPRPRFVVPSGNFGNLTAAEYARRMGIPFEGCVAATNVNDVVPEYFASGVYKPRASIATLSNAMDVGRPSNLDRLLALEAGSVAELARAIPAYRVTDDETTAEIRRTFDDTGRTIDPHTAVGVAAARDFRTSRPGPVIVAATAHPAKFRETVESATGQSVPLPESLQQALEKPAFSVPLDADYAAFRRLLTS